MQSSIGQRGAVGSGGRARRNCGGEPTDVSGGGRDSAAVAADAAVIGRAEAGADRVFVGVGVRGTEIGAKGSSEAGGWTGGLLAKSPYGTLQIADWIGEKP